MGPNNLVLGIDSLHFDVFALTVIDGKIRLMEDKVTDIRS